MSGIFLSYAREDLPRVTPLVDFLLSKGLDVWWDRFIQPGENFEESIDDQILQAKCVIVVWSRTSINSRWVKNEALEGQDRGILVPVQFDDVRIPVAFKQTQAADFTRWPDAVDEGEIQTFLNAIYEKLEKEEQPDSSYTPPRKNKAAWFGLAAAVILTAIAGLSYFWNPNQQTVENADPRIAIMRFRDIGNGEQTYFADSLSSEIYESLRPVEHVQTASQFASWDVPEDMPDDEVASRLNVQYLVHGKLIGDRSQSRVMISLRDSKGDDIWQREYEVSSSSIQRITQHVTDHLLTQLDVPNGGVGGQAPTRYVTDSEPAYDFYLKGRDLIRQSDETASLELAKENFEKAIAQDGRFVQAYSALCRTYIFLYESSNDAIQFEGAERACNRALTLEPTEAEANLALGNLYSYSGKPQLAEPQLKRALQLEPDNADAHIALGYMYLDMQSFDESLKAFDLAVESQPGYWRAFNARGIFHFQQGDYPNAIENFTRVTMLNPENSGAFNNLGTAKYFIGEFNDAIEAWKQSEALSPGREVLSNMGTGYYYLREFDMAQDMYRRAIEAAPKDHRLWGNLADTQRMANLGTDANETYRKAIDLAMDEYAINDGDAISLSRLAVYHAALENRGPAMEFLRLARETGAGNPYVLYDTVVTYLLLDSPSEASDFYRELANSGFPKSILDAEPMFDALPDMAN